MKVYRTYNKKAQTLKKNNLQSQWFYFGSELFISETIDSIKYMCYLDTLLSQGNAG